MKRESRIAAVARCTRVLSWSLASGLALFPAVAVQAAMVYWNGSASSDWTDTNNWTDSTIPLPTDIVGFGRTGYSHFPSVGPGARAVGGIKIAAGSASVSVIAGSGGSLSLASGGIDAADGSSGLAISCPVTLTAPQVWRSDDDDALTFSGELSGGADLTKSGSGEMIFSAANASYTGTVAVEGGVLRLDTSAGSLSGAGAYGIGASGTLLLDNSHGINSQRLKDSSGIALRGGTLTLLGGGSISLTEAVGAVAPRAGDSTVRIDGTGSGTYTLAAAALGTPLPGATLNIIGLGTNHKLTVPGTTSEFIHQGVFVGGDSYGWYEAVTGGRTVRAIRYGTGPNDDDVAISIGPADTIGEAHQWKHINLTGTIGAQTSIQISTLRIPGPFDFLLAGGQTVTVWRGGILKSGNGAARIQGGNGITTGSGAELVVRTDSPGDSLTLSTCILDTSAGGLTKSGAGTLVIRAPQFYRGNTTINQGTVELGWPDAPAGGSLLWLDAADTGTVTRDGSNVVSEWKNKATGQSATQSIPDRRPLYISGAIGGLPSVRFDGIDDVLKSATSSDASGFYWNDQPTMSIFIVAQRATAKPFGGPLSLIGPLSATDYNHPSVLAIEENSDGSQLRTVRGNCEMSAAIHPGNGQTYVMATIFDGARNTLYLNGVASRAEDSTEAFNINRVAVGARFIGGAPQNNWNGDVAEVLIYNTALDERERRLVEAYLEHKWMNTGAAADLLPPDTRMSIARGATLDLGGTSQTLASLADVDGEGGDVLLGGGTLTVAAADPSATFSGTIRGPGGVVKQGGGTWRLAGANAFDGVMTVKDGTLEIAGADALPPGTSLAILGGTVKLAPGLGRAIELGSLVIQVPAPSPPASPVPEPGGLGLLLAGALASLAWHGRKVGRSDHFFPWYTRT